MKNLLFIAFFGAIIYFGFMKTSFEKEFLFDGEVYSHSKKENGGSLVNHYYTPDGKAPNFAKDYLLILEFPEMVQKESWSSILKPVFAGYNLKPVKKQPYDMAGSFERGGLHYKSFATPITIDEQDHLILYFIVTGEAAVRVPTSRKVELINKLKGLQSTFS